MDIPLPPQKFRPVGPPALVPQSQPSSPTQSPIASPRVIKSVSFTSARALQAPSIRLQGVHAQSSPSLLPPPRLYTPPIEPRAVHSIRRQGPNFTPDFRSSRSSAVTPPESPKARGNTAPFSTDKRKAFGKRKTKLGSFLHLDKLPGWKPLIEQKTREANPKPLPTQTSEPNTPTKIEGTLSPRTLFASKQFHSCKTLPTQKTESLEVTKASTSKKSPPHTPKAHRSPGFLRRFRKQPSCDSLFGQQGTTRRTVDLPTLLQDHQRSVYQMLPLDFSRGFNPKTTLGSDFYAAAFFRGLSIYHLTPSGKGSWKCLLPRIEENSLCSLLVNLESPNIFPGLIPYITQLNFASKTALLFYRIALFIRSVKGEIKRAERAYQTSAEQIEITAQEIETITDKLMKLKSVTVTSAKTAKGKKGKKCEESIALESDRLESLLDSKKRKLSTLEKERNKKWSEIVKLKPLWTDFAPALDNPKTFFKIFSKYIAEIQRVQTVERSKRPGHLRFLVDHLMKIFKHLRAVECLSVLDRLTKKCMHSNEPSENLNKHILRLLISEKDVEGDFREVGRSLLCGPMDEGLPPVLLPLSALRQEFINSQGEFLWQVLNNTPSLKHLELYNKFAKDPSQDINGHKRRPFKRVDGTEDVVIQVSEMTGDQEEKCHRIDFQHHSWFEIGYGIALLQANTRLTLKFDEQGRPSWAQPKLKFQVLSDADYLKDQKKYDRMREDPTTPYDGKWAQTLKEVLGHAHRTPRNLEQTGNLTPGTRLEKKLWESSGHCDLSL